MGDCRVMLNKVMHMCTLISFMLSLLIRYYKPLKISLQAILQMFKIIHDENSIEYTWTNERIFSHMGQLVIKNGNEL